MNLEETAEHFHNETGATGAELEMMTFAYAVLLSKLAKNDEAEAHFNRRLNESAAKMEDA